MIDKIKKLTDKQKILILVLIIALIISLFIINISFGNENVSTSVIPNQVVSGLSFENAYIEQTEGISKFISEVYNDQPNTYNLKYIEVILYDVDNNELERLYGYIGDSINSNSSKTLEIKIDNDISNYAKVEYVIHT